MHRILRTLLVFVLLAAAGFAADDFAETKKKAEAGDAVAQNTLGNMYYNGEGVPKDTAEAVKWWRKAADQGDANAQTILGWMYERGEGVPKDDVEAVKWWRKAADQRNAHAQCYLGVMYYNGDGVSKDLAEALSWWRLAADQGYADAQYNLGNMYYDGLLYYNGEVVPRDNAETAKWFRLAAEQGNAKAQYKLGYMYENGEGVPKDDVEAVKWYRKAAGQGNVDAQSNLGLRQAAMARKQAAAAAATEAYAKYTGGVAKLVIKGLAIGMSIDAALEVLNERLSGVLEGKFEIEPSESGAYIGFPAPFMLKFSIKCEVNNNVVTSIFLPAASTNALFNTADMEASVFARQICTNYGIKEMIPYQDGYNFIAGTIGRGWEYSSPEGYRIRVSEYKDIHMQKIPKSNERRFN